MKILLLVKNMKSRASCYIVFFALIKCARASFRTSDRS